MRGKDPAKTELSMNEFLFLVIFGFVFFFRRKIKLLFLAGFLFIVIVVLKDVSLYVCLSWLVACSIILLIDKNREKLITSEVEKKRREHDAVKSHLARTENKLIEMDKFNKRLQQEVNKITDFFEISKELTKVMYLDQLPAVLVNVVKGGFEIKSLDLLILEEGQNKGIFIYPDENKVELRENIEIPLLIDGEKIISEEEAGFYDGEDLEPLFLKLGYQISRQKMYVIPLIREGKMIGLLVLDNLNEDKIDLAHTLAGFLSLTLRKIKLYEKVQDLAITDELTQVFVKRHFLEVYREELSRIQNKGDSACFLMLDLDRFKNCNDTFGHLVGDAILKDIATIIKQSVREVDLVGRYGGEEFCVFLPETRLENGLYVAERIWKAVEKHVFHAYDETLKMTVSVGISAFPEDAFENIELIEKADLALYYAKRKGRNRVIVYSNIK